MRVLGIDPGSRVTGWGVVDVQGKTIRHVGHGVFRLNPGSKTLPLADRLLTLHDSLSALAERMEPDALSLEKVFFAKNASSALQLGQARGVVLLSGSRYAMEIFEYNPTEVKSSIVGHGRADKDQIQKMMGLLFKVKEFETNDASDGLALALCHAQLHQTQKRMGQRNGQGELPQKKRKRSMSLAEALGVDKK